MTQRQKETSTLYLKLPIAVEALDGTHRIPLHAT